MRIAGDEILRLRAQVGEVAAATAGDEDFLARRVGVVEQEHRSAALPCGERAHHACGACAYDDDVEEDGNLKRRKHFFFEKKKQKTFAKEAEPVREERLSALRPARLSSSFLS
jgi:hypothetical protein